MWPWFLLALLAPIAFLVAEYKNRQPFALHFDSRMAPNEALGVARGIYTAREWHITSEAQHAIEVARQANPPVGTSILFVAIGMVQAILYLLFGTKMLTAVVYAESDGRGGTRMLIHGNANGFDSEVDAAAVNDAVGGIYRRT